MDEYILLKNSYGIYYVVVDKRVHSGSGEASVQVHLPGQPDAMWWVPIQSCTIFEDALVGEVACPTSSDSHRSSIGDGGDEGDDSVTHLSPNYFTRRVPRRGGPGGSSGGSGGSSDGGSSHHSSSRSRSSGRSSRLSSNGYKGSHWHQGGKGDKEPRYRSDMPPKTPMYDGNKDPHIIESYP